MDQLPHDEIASNLKFEIGHVLFIDIVGYSKGLINEQSDSLQKLKEIVRGAEQFRLAEAEGKLLRLPTGDGGALVFRNNPEAPVLCAMEIAQALKSYRQFRVRMGIHSGPVNEISDLNEQANIAGAGINLAQRVMDCGDAGHILLSRHVAEDLEHYPRWRPYLHELGECEVKHGGRVHLFNCYGEGFGNEVVPSRLRDAVKVARKESRARWLIVAGLIALVLIAAAIWQLSHHQPDLNNVVEKSIAVLPFENLSEDKANTYFAEGMQDEILTRLANLRELKVISRTSTAKYKSRPENLKTIAAELGVANILEGSVQKIGNEVHIAVQLIKAGTDEHLWAQSYDRTIEHVFAVEAEVAQTVADALKVTLLPAQIAKLKTLPTENAQAYDLFLKGEYQFHRSWTGEDEFSGTISKAADYFREATKIDPKFSLAYASIARAELSEYHFLHDFGRAERRTDLAEDAKRNIDHSLGITPELPKAHLALGEWSYWVAHDYPTAIEEFQRAINIDPNLPDAFIRLASVAMRQADPERALAQLQSAIPIDPRNVEVHRLIAIAYQMQRKYRLASASFARALAIDPNDVSDIVNQARNFRILGDLAAAERVIESYPAAQRSNNGFLEMKFNFLARKRDYQGMEELVRDTPPRAFSSEWNRMIAQGKIAQGLGRAEAARDFFKQARTMVLAEIAKDAEEPETYAELGWLNATLNRADEAISEAQRAVALSEKTHDFWSVTNSMVKLASVYAKLGRADDAIPVLSRLFATPTGSLISTEQLKHDLDWDPIRNDPRFQELVASAERSSS